MESYEHQQGVSTHAVDKYLLQYSLSTQQLRPTIESTYRTVSVFLCHWDTDAENYPEIDSGIHALRKTFEDQYGFPTEVHELEQAKSGPKNQLTLLSRFMPLLYDTSPDPTMPCRCNEGMHRYRNKPEEVNLFIFFYIRFSEIATDGSCLLRPMDQPGQQDPTMPLPSVNFSSISRATMDMGESRVLLLLDCPYDGPSAMGTDKELIAAGSALWTPSSEFTTHLAHHLQRAARERRIMNTPLLFSKLANTLPIPPVKATSAVNTSQSVLPPSKCKYEPISLVPIDEKRMYESWWKPPKVKRRWQPMDVDEPGVSTEVTIAVRHQDDDTRQVTLRASVWYCLPNSPSVTSISVENTKESEAIVPLPKRRSRKKKPASPEQSVPEQPVPVPDENKGFPAPQKPKVRLGEQSKLGLRTLLQGIDQDIETNEPSGSVLVTFTILVSVWANLCDHPGLKTIAMLGATKDITVPQRVLGNVNIPQRPAEKRQSLGGSENIRL
ncbi:hypothetical protein PG994_005474 [Apiospora phragmitis]|uniref:Uncharacterized protein n=1 Tax=Apiospora phragmitis TaxID=2905665 RepID=A0ABR1VCF0_9PEZI